MRVDWLQAVHSDTAHIAIVDDVGHATPICDSIFLNDVTKAEKETKRCADCTKKWLSGDEISFLAKDGRRIVIRAKGAPVWQGSLDPFQDIAEQLSRMSVAYMLVVAIQGEKRTRYWTNLTAFGKPAVAAFRKEAETVCDRVDKLIESKGG